MGSEARDGFEPEAATEDGAETAPDESSNSIARLELALERIEAQAHRDKPEAGTGLLPVADLAGRLDALIAQLRTVLADRPVRD